MLLDPSLDIDIQVVGDDASADPHDAEFIFADEVQPSKVRGPVVRQITIDLLMSPASDYLTTAVTLRDPHPWQLPA